MLPDGVFTPTDTCPFIRPEAAFIRTLKKYVERPNS